MQGEKVGREGHTDESLTMRYAYIDDKVERRLIMQMSVGKEGDAPEVKTIEKRQGEINKSGLGI